MKQRKITVTECLTCALCSEGIPLALHGRILGLLDMLFSSFSLKIFTDSQKLSSRENVCSVAASRLLLLFALWPAYCRGETYC